MTSSNEPQDRLRRRIHEFANRQRDLADEAARMYGGCDDPLHPTDPEHRSGIDSWQDFVDKVARPIVEADGEWQDARVQEAMRVFRNVSPYYICVAMVMMEKRIRDGLPPDVNSRER